MFETHHVRAHDQDPCLAWRTGYLSSSSFFIRDLNQYIFTLTTLYPLLLASNLDRLSQNLLSLDCNGSCYSTNDVCSPLCSSWMPYVLWHEHLVSNGSFLLLASLAK